VVYICIEKQKVVWIPKLRENGWEAAASALSYLVATRIATIFSPFFLIFNFNFFL
jgi:hypothetical protein